MLFAKHDRTIIIRPDDLIRPAQNFTRPVSPPADAYGKSRPLRINYALSFSLKPPTPLDSSTDHSATMHPTSLSLAIRLE